MSPDTPRADNDRGRIVPFRRRGKPRPNGPPSGDHETPVEGVEKYGSAGEPDNYRQRMINNGMAFGACVVLVLIGVWIANTMADMRKKQECVLSGRRDCASITTPSAGPTK
ncbi:MAG: hypothetical protein E6G97_13410 [Alphaproteobacteria bacterium]|nr:MAG: hypothetical protein E6G97_13410 [Alphaproteobacteria bacterium]